MTLTKGRIDRAGKVVFHDASISIWEEGLHQRMSWDERTAWERQFKRDVFARIVQTLRRIGWTVGEQTYIFTGNNSRYCRKGDLQADLKLSGRCIEFDMFQDVNAPDRPDHGGRYQSDKEGHMPYVMRLEMERTRRRIRDYLCNVFTGYEFEPPRYPKMGLVGLTAEEKAAHDRRTNGHYKPHLDRAEIGMKSNARAVDGGTIEHGSKVWALDHKGRIVTGTAYYYLNNNWQIVTGRYGLLSAHTGNIFTRQPENLRIKRNSEQRRRRIEKDLQKAIDTMQFERAAVLRDILFPGSPELYVVWHKEHKAYHCSGFCGYTTDQSKAGKFTADEVRGWDCDPNKVIAIARAAEANHG